MSSATAGAAAAAAAASEGTPSEGTRSPPLYVELDESSVGEIDWHSPFRDGTAMWRVTIGDWCAMPLPLVSFANVEDDQ